MTDVSGVRGQRQLRGATEWNDGIDWRGRYGIGWHHASVHARDTEARGAPGSDLRACGQRFTRDEGAQQRERRCNHEVEPFHPVFHVCGQNRFDRRGNVTAYCQISKSRFWFTRVIFEQDETRLIPADEGRVGILKAGRSSCLRRYEVGQASDGPHCARRQSATGKLTSECRREWWSRLSRQAVTTRVGGHGAWGMGHGAWGMGHGAWAWSGRVSRAPCPVPHALT